MQQILYTRSDDVSLAYTVSGSADLPLIFIPGIVSNLALDQSNPPLARFYERVARFSRLVRWDRRGTGLSDQSADPLPLAEQARDLEAIRSAVGFERFAVIGYSHGTSLAARYAAEHPERVSHLVLIAGPVCDARDPGDPSRPLAPWPRLIEATQDFATYVDRFVADARGLGVGIRAGVHAGEAYAVEDQLFGTCVTVAARVAAQAGAGELFTSETVQDVVAGAGFAFHDAGVFELKGLGSRRLLSVG